MVVGPDPSRPPRLRVTRPQLRGAPRPGRRRGHTMTTVRVLELDVAVVIGGWGHGEEVSMQPFLLSCVHTHEAAAVSGAAVSSAAVSSATVSSAAVSSAAGSRRAANPNPNPNPPSFQWEKPHITGAPPAGRAFHSTTAIGRARIVVNPA